MKRLKLILAAVFVAALVGCASTPLLDQEVIAMHAVTSARQISTAKLRDGSITLVADQKNQAVLTGMATAIKAAVAANDSSTIAAKKAEADKLAITLKGQ